MRAGIVAFGLMSVGAEMGCTTFLVREISKDRTRTGAYVVHLTAMSLLLASLVLALSRLIVPHLGYSPDLLAMSARP